MPLSDESINDYKVISYKIDSTHPPIIQDFKNVTHEMYCILNNTTDTFQYNSYILILGLKLYEYQYNTFHQGYELEVSFLPFSNNRITSELIKLTKSRDDYLTPRIAYEYVKEHTIYKNNAEIKKLFIHIELIESEINKYSTD